MNQFQTGKRKNRNSRSSQTDERDPIVSFISFPPGANYTRDKLFPMMQTLLDKDPHAKLTESYFKAVVTDTFVKADDEFLVRHGLIEKW